MLPHQQRVVDEKNELDEKRANLCKFFSTALFKSLAKDEQDRLDHQAFHMGAYSDVLAARISYFK